MSRVLIVLFILILGSCQEEISKEVEENLGPPLAIPETACAGHIQDGYTDKVSYLPGELMKVYLNSNNPLELCRLTIYNIEGDSIFSIGSLLPVQYPVITNGLGSIVGFNYSCTAWSPVPKIKSGIYLIEKTIPFIIKTTDPVDITVIYPSNTVNAYTESGGLSLYTKVGRPSEVSFHRPMTLQNFSEYCLRWFTTLNDISIGYVADIDLEKFTNINASKILAVVGHSEYWTRQARVNFDKFVDTGGHALILSGNTMWFQVRYSHNNTRLVCYKDFEKDPILFPTFRTTEWHQPGLGYPITSSIGVDFELGGYGVENDNGWDGYKIVQPNSPLFEGLNLSKYDIVSLPTVEYDGAPLKGYDPDGIPIINNDLLKFEKIELIGFDKGYRYKETTATFIVFKKTASSGIVVNTSSTDWCSLSGMGSPSGDVIKKITYNAITKLLNDDPIF